MAIAAAAPALASAHWNPPSLTLTTTVDGRSLLGAGEGFVFAPWLGAVTSDSSSATRGEPPKPMGDPHSTSHVGVTSPSMWQRA